MTQVRTFLLHSNLFVTLDNPQKHIAIADALHYTIGVMRKKRFMSVKEMYYDICSAL